MMKRCVFITAGDAACGFSLAGFQHVVADSGSVIAEFEKITRQGEPGLVIIDERLLTGMNTARINSIEQRWAGAMVVLPAPGSEVDREGADYGNRLIERVLGYQMKLTL